jgi:hypothetical protein
VIQVRQDTETPLTTVSTPFGALRYLYARSGDSVESETVGQDYVAFRHDAARVTFAVCDGVGQSFMGDLAARILGDGLVTWLWKAKRPSDAVVFADQVMEALNALTDEGERQVQAFELPPHLPPLIVQALENQRAYGSESMFVAGRIELGHKVPWIALAWLGDSPVAAIDIKGQLVDLGPQGHTSERWNALTGVKGQIHSWVGDAEDVARVMGYSDGLGLAHPPTDDDLVQLEALWQTNPPADDASLFDVRLVPQPEEQAEPSPAQEKRAAKVSSKERAAPQPEPAASDASDSEHESELATPPLEGWQRAALVGLTGLALTLFMVKRLVEQEYVQPDS